MNRRELLKVTAAATALSATRAFGDISATTEPSKGDWPMWRHDARMIGYQPLPGNISQEPRAAGKYSLGSSPAVGTPVDLYGDGQSEYLAIAEGKVFAFDHTGNALWASNAPGYFITDLKWIVDLDSDGVKEIVVQANHVGGTHLSFVILDIHSGEKRAAIDFITGDYGSTGLCGKYLAGSMGKQIFLVTSCKQGEFGPPTQMGEFSLWTFDGNETKRSWAYVPPEFTVYYPAVMAAELEPKAPGKFFGVVNSWCHVWSVELATGKVVSHENWDTHSASPRQYGWNELIDVDGDGALDYVNISLTKHVDVLRNDGTGRLKLAWSHGWMDVITTEKRALRPISNGIIDLDGDGKKEIIAAIFDGLKDNRWHLFIWNGATGAQIAEGPDLTPLATVGLQGEGKPRVILCARSTTRQYDPPPQLEAWALRDGKLEHLWTAPPHTKMQSVPSELSDRRACQYNSMHVNDPVLVTTTDGRVAFTTTDWDGSDPRAWGLSDNNQIVEKPLPPTPTSAPSAPTLPNLVGSTVPYLLAADVDSDGRNELLFYDNATVTFLKYDGGRFRVIRKMPSTEIPIVCDLLGDGRPIVLTGGREATSNLYVRATAPDGTVLWNFVFDKSEACGQYSDRPHYFLVGHFTGGKHLDVFTWSMKPDPRAYVLDGRTGKPIYRKDDLPHIDRSFQAFGGRATVFDFNGDGADDILFTDPDYYCVADGKTGNLLVGPVELQPLLKWWAAYSTPIVLQPADAKAKPFVYLGGAYSSRCAISLDGKQCLFKEYVPTERWSILDGPARFIEGLLPPSKINGKWRVAQVEASGTLQLFEAESGKHIWSTNIATDAGTILSGDIDGDGEPELLFGGKDGKLHCIRDAGREPKMVWTKAFDAPIASVLFADINDDGKCEIIASVGDGNVYVLDGKSDT